MDFYLSLSPYLRAGDMNINIFFIPPFVKIERRGMDDDGAFILHLDDSACIKERIPGSNLPALVVNNGESMLESG